MCGILCLLNGVVFGNSDVLLSDAWMERAHAEQKDIHHEAVVDDFVESLKRRGPDLLEEIHVDLSDYGTTLHLAGSLLQLRGQEKSRAIHIDSHGNVLIFNGEIYKGLGIEWHENDAMSLSVALERAENEKDVIGTLATLIGPWSVVYWRQDAKELWFGRDSLAFCCVVTQGRRSLLFFYHPRMQQCVFSSTAPLNNSEDRMQGVEVPPAIYRLKLSSQTNEKLLEDMHIWRRHPSARSLSFSSLNAAAEVLLFKLRQSVKVPPLKPWYLKTGFENRSVIVLFSGGVDSTFLAALLHEVVPTHLPIDLCNVSFNGSEAPDRISNKHIHVLHGNHSGLAGSLEAYSELRRWAPGRQWNLICVDSTLESLAASKDRVLRLLNPCDTVMDFNIGSAVWLAARAQGHLHPSGTAYTSSARMAFVGHGADEQFAGYARHRTKFREKQWTGLRDELNLEMARLWERNLGRDDRLISDHGREARLPFLDEDLVAFLQEMPLPFLFDPKKPRGFGEKLVLREALRLIGLFEVATREKRAIQFGSHIAKLTNREQFGSNRRANKHNAGGLPLEKS